MKVQQHIKLLVAFAISIAIISVQVLGMEAQPRTPTRENVTTTRQIEGRMSRTGNAISCSTRDSAYPPAPTSRNGVTDTKYRWQNFYVWVDPAYSQDEYNMINNAMYRLYITFQKCMNFGIYPRNSAKPSGGDYVWVRKAQGCTAAVGKQGGDQWMSLETPGCIHMSVIMHEMLHSMGLYHEQSRLDRDDYVNILYQNIQPEYTFAFDKVQGTSAYGVPYNVNSIMHYGSHDFSKNGQPTITAKNGAQVGSKGDLQQTDIDKIKKMYNC